MRAQEAGVAALDADDLQNDKSVALDQLPWKYHAGDREEWEAENFDDGGWKSLTNVQINDDLSSLEDWRGRAWFRLKIAVDERLVGQPLAWRMWQWGASEIYLDGKLIQSYGTIAPDGDTEYNPRGLSFPVVFTRGGTHTIAVRYQFQAGGAAASGGWLVRGGYLPGFRLVVERGENAAPKLESRLRDERLFYVFVGLFLALALVHFLLFVFYRQALSNFFYSLFVAGLALSFYLQNLLGTAHFGAAAALSTDIARLNVQSLAVISLLIFLYVEFAGRPSRFVWALLAFWLLSIGLHTAQIWNEFPYTLTMLIVTLAACLRIMASALIKRRSGAWIIAAGVLALALGVLINVSIEKKLIKVPDWLYNLNLYLTVLSVPLTVSVYLARNFARTNRHLEQRLAQIQELSAQQLEHERTEAELRLAHERTQAENERRAQELEEARQLQLSMLPKTLPKIPNLEIAVYMKPASEIGGDYYDFHVSNDGTLTVAVGDATGHGLKAGSMVTATKSLFNAFAGQENVPQIFRQISAALKAMNLRGLFMAMAMLKIKDRRVSLSLAGMPAALVCRGAAKTVEEIAIRAVPLGSIAKFPYQSRSFDLAAGDCIVLMSDGFPEMFSPENELLGFGKAAELLPEIADRSPQEIINHFVEVGERWAGKRLPDDDVTFVVLKAV